ncbi:MAG: sulfurtransferase TusA family protein [Planctomycetaceae bacterium]|nr:sulfurtransferase TusA family protein [Planctomycetaceae bacterium]
MPIVELTKLARTLTPGDRIEVTATDLAFRPDLEAWSRRMSHAIESFEEEDGIQRAVILIT